ncbi:proprotein convertase subtilisin/kexin type 4-like [Penaeus japonicus]|uniref:proprotein convertase subtilisin/kexin type 4-like n=1 Tax=Penaeus japonicus TaxID=27405 RepID=UPI001C7128EB|nr:proprotein convertase subtilisin/kexin type 4-like [Penaeus japonicus]
MARKTVMTRCQSLAKCQHGRVIALILTLSVATRVRAEDEVWAVQLGREHVGDAPRVAEDLGMTIPAKSPFDLLKTQDPLRWRQWYLGAGEGMFLNVTGLWAQGVRGGGVSVAILDDGVRLTHLDLALNYDPAASWDLLDADPGRRPCPGRATAPSWPASWRPPWHNGLCGMGMAPWTGVGAVRMLGYVVWDAVEAAALSYERDHVDVYLAAWGPVDTGAVMEVGRPRRPGPCAGIVLGRKGRGSIYIWASGNGGFVGDDCNADGYANSVYTLTVSGSTRDGRPPDYAETCAATFVSTYSGDADPEYQPEERVNGIVTTDTGGECTESFRGSSVSAAMVAGACALALDASPGASFFHPLTFFTFHAFTIFLSGGATSAPDGAGGHTAYCRITGRPTASGACTRTTSASAPSTPGGWWTSVFVLPLTISNCQIVETEHVQVNISISSDNRGQLEIDLESPSGTTSKLLPKRPLDVSPYGINRHPFLSVHAWGENPLGTWKVRVVYHKSNILEEFGKKLFVDVPNMMLNWSLVVHGTEVPFSEATPHHYHFNRTQLTEALRTQRTHRRSRGGRRTRAKPGTGDDSFRIHTDHWTSTVVKGGKPHSYLLCKVMSSSPALVTSITWHDANGGAPRDVIKRLTGRGALGDKYPALLIVRETPNFEGNFTCRVTFDGRRCGNHWTSAVTFPPCLS